MKTLQPVAAHDCQDTENYRAHRRAGGRNKLPPTLKAVSRLSLKSLMEGDSS